MAKQIAHLDSEESDDEASKEGVRRRKATKNEREAADKKRKTSKENDNYTGTATNGDANGVRGQKTSKGSQTRGAGRGRGQKRPAGNSGIGEEGGNPSKSRRLEEDKVPATRTGSPSMVAKTQPTQNLLDQFDDAAEAKRGRAKQ